MTTAERIHKLRETMLDTLRFAQDSVEDEGYAYAFGCASAGLEIAAERLDAIASELEQEAPCKS